MQFSSGLVVELQNGTGNGGNGCGTGLDEVDDSGFFQNRHSNLNYAMKVGVPVVRIEG